MARCLRLGVIIWAAVVAMPGSSYSLAADNGSEPPGIHFLLRDFAHTPPETLDITIKQITKTFKAIGVSVRFSYPSLETDIDAGCSEFETTSRFKTSFERRVRRRNKSFRVQTRSGTVNAHNYLATCKVTVANAVESGVIFSQTATKSSCLRSRRIGCAIAPITVEIMPQFAFVRSFPCL